MFLLLLATIFCFARVAHSYKAVMFVPTIAQSQVIFNVRIAEKLTAAGHNVTLVLLNMFRFEKEKQLQTNITVLPWEMYVLDWEKQSQPEVNFKELSVWEARTLMAQKLGIFPASCEKMLKDTEFIERLRAEQFDVAFLPMFDLCTVGIVKHIGIDAWIWLNTGRLMDYVAYYIGLPSPPSYVPPMMSDLPGNMTFLQRAKSFLGWTMTMLIYERSVVGHENALFRRYIDRNFPDLTEVARMCPLVMVNSDELYDQARPTFHKVVNIGGIGMKHGDQKPLEGEFRKIVEKASNIVVMTMGSHAQLSAMPEKWKMAFMNAFRKFDDHHFILRYESDDLNAKKPNNVHFSKWLPQNDLLHHPKTRLMITHGGYNSVQEAIHAGVPLIALALFGDQFTNGRIMESHGIGRILRKSEINEQRITELLNSFLRDRKYKDAARRMRRMIEKRPESAEDRLLAWTEFVVEFKPLDNLTPYAVQLGFVQYHCLDVIAFLALCVLLVAWIIFLLIKMVVKIFRIPSLRKQKTQ
uniref:UDP-glucuronosyltransferase n=3 Tax=Parascaris TaxID=6254 RepID=A0A915C665_PARUN